MVDRGVVDILRDHSEVANVLRGGLGTAALTDTTWDYGKPHQSPTVGTTSQTVDTSHPPLPFANCEVPSLFAAAAKPVVKTNNLKEYKIIYGDRAFNDRRLPPPIKQVSPHPRFTPTYYIALHNLAAGPGHDGNGFSYPANTPNFRGARIPLAHTGLKIANWRRHLIGYGDDVELLQFMEFGFPLGLVESPDLSPCDRNHGSSYQFYPHIDKFVTAEILRGGLTGPFSAPPWPSFMLSPLMTAPKKPRI